VFAWNEPDVLIETNVRTVFIHHFYPRSKSISDELLMPLIAAALDTKKPREWYSALMDYGTYLKATVGNLSSKSVTHVPQKRFKGSEREVRGKILAFLSEGTSLDKLPFKKERILPALVALEREKLISKKAKNYILG
jgi:A/G-specific adenine glycosylase